MDARSALALVRDDAAAPSAAGTPAGAPPARHYVHAGQLAVVRGPAEITTILGTCVAVCLWDPVRQVGGINHYLLPHLVGDAVASPRFGTHAIAELIEAVSRAAGAGVRLQAKVFGGLRARMRAATHRDLGAANAELAFRLLADAGIRVVASDVGGERGRKLIFRLPSGEALVKYL